jgi:hypothetical protein
MKQMMALVAAGLLVTACGGGESPGQGVTQTVDAGDGNSATVRYGGGDNGIAPPANLPDFAAIYPGAMIQSAVTGNEGEANGMVTYLTPAKMADVIAFYREKGKTAGLTVAAEAAMGESRMLAMKRGDSNDVGLQITVAPPGDGGRTMVSVVYDGGKPA